MITIEKAPLNYPIEGKNPFVDYHVLNIIKN